MEAYIAGKPLLSTTDWPSKVSCVVFFAGCNLRCRFCFNTPLLEFGEHYKVDLELVYLELEASQYLIDGVIVTGGEPTLQAAPLRNLAEWTKNHGLEFGIMTNGTKPDVLNQFLDAALLDYIAVDIKTVPEKSQYVHLTQSTSAVLERVKETVSLCKASKIQYEFRTTLVPSIIDSTNQIDQIRKWLKTPHYVLQLFRPEDTVLDPSLNFAFTPEQVDQFHQYAKKHGIITRF
ncbi:MAG: anaerobic ribonucleoside-triphosphate reductase activating protein [Promethearchaeota archaeon]